MANFDIKKDIQEAIKIYSGLRFISNPYYSLEGRIPICMKDGTIITEYDVKIIYGKCFPYCFPKTFETGGKIPHDVERHINVGDGSICLAVRPVEKLICLPGISSIKFIKEILIPHLAGQFLYDNGDESIIKGGYDHYENGIKQFYLELFKTENWKDVEEGFKNVIEIKKLEPNSLCYCGSNIKYKKCHKDAIDTLKRLGSDYLKNELEIINKKK